MLTYGKGIVKPTSAGNAVTRRSLFSGQSQPTTKLIRTTAATTFIVPIGSRRIAGIPYASSTPSVTP